jgi:hypothetical protein
MAQANKERQEAFRQRKLAAGYKRKQAWVREGTNWGLWERFIEKAEELTAGWSETRLSGLFNRLIKAVKSETGKEGPEEETKG